MCGSWPALWPGVACVWLDRRQFMCLPCTLAVVGLAPSLAGGLPVRRHAACPVPVYGLASAAAAFNDEGRRWQVLAPVMEGRLPPGRNDLCCQLLKRKYLNKKPILSLKWNRGSQFWRGVNKIKHGFSWGAVFEVKNGKSVRFWDDVWEGDTPLRITYPRLYDLSNDKTHLVRDLLKDGDWHLNFRRSLSESEMETWEDLMNRLEGVLLNNEPDKVRWALEKSGMFTTRSMYRWFMHRGVVNKRPAAEQRRKSGQRMG
ncbi:hypothetical protein PVAP13_2KG399500 [Panicum virgatum]|uniref:Uncharacterized protein n=1 Tax=Panicum virgatum TaxID=38727 RepID=A0A8T0WCR7_PANVG|nr:hypothetical protein PVAP13_2KG399500 [Panicum virgatum]